MSNLSLYQRGYGRRKPGGWARPDQSHPLAKQLVLCLPLNDNTVTTGKLRDWSDYNNPATMNVALAAFWVPGYLGLAMKGDGTGNSGIFVANSTSLQLTGDWSYALWFKTTYAGFNVLSLFAKWDGAGSGRQIRIYMVAGNITVQIPFVASIITGATAWNDGRWHLMVATKKSTTWTLYVDAVVDATAVDSSTQEAATTSLQIGCDGTGGGNYWDGGAYDYPLVWKRALLAGEVTQLFREPFCFWQQSSLHQYSSFSPAAALFPEMFVQNCEPVPGRRAVVAY